MPESKRKLLLNVFKKLKQKVIWKWETEKMEGLPSNVKLSKWLPQQDILAHPNTKMFITHAGQSSTQETLCHKTPVVRKPKLIPILSQISCHTLFFRWQFPSMGISLQMLIS